MSNGGMGDARHPSRRDRACGQAASTATSGPSAPEPARCPSAAAQAPPACRAAAGRGACHLPPGRYPQAAARPRHAICRRAGTPKLLRGLGTPSAAGQAPPSCYAAPGRAARLVGATLGIDRHRASTGNGRAASGARPLHSGGGNPKVRDRVAGSRCLRSGVGRGCVEPCLDGQHEPFRVPRVAGSQSGPHDRPASGATLTRNRER
jgi:hypothetical protein